MRCLHVVSVVLLTAWLTSTCVADPDLVAYGEESVNGIDVHIVTADLRSPRIEIAVELADGFPHGSQPLESFIGDDPPLAGINGAFFCTKGLQPIGDVVVDGQLLHFGGMGTAIGVTADNRVEVCSVERYRHQDWSDYETVLGGGIALLRAGKSCLAPKAEGFSEHRVIHGRARRAAVGVTPDHKLRLLATAAHITLDELGSIMEAVGCDEGVALDGGHSVGLTFDGKPLVTPTRNLPTMLVVRERRDAPPDPIALAAAASVEDTDIDRRAQRMRHPFIADATQQRTVPNDKWSEGCPIMWLVPPLLAYLVLRARMSSPSACRRSTCTTSTAAIGTAA